MLELVDFGAVEMSSEHFAYEKDINFRCPEGGESYTKLCPPNSYGDVIITSISECDCIWI